MKFIDHETGKVWDKKAFQLWSKDSTNFFNAVWRKLIKLDTSFDSIDDVKSWYDSLASEMVNNEKSPHWLGR